jgi:hypothetical protein
MKKIIVLSAILTLLISVGLVQAAKPVFDTPSDLSANAISSTEIDLAWTDNSNNEAGFAIERSLDGVDFTEINTVDEGVTSYSDAGLSLDTQYFYQVRAFRNQGKKVKYSAYSNTASATTPGEPPAAPTNLTAVTIYATTTDVFLQWSDNSNNEDNFLVERGTDGVNFSQIDTTSADIFWYLDNDLSVGTYYYRVRASNLFGNSGYSHTASSTVI